MRADAGRRAEGPPAAPRRSTAERSRPARTEGRLCPRSEAKQVSRPAVSAPVERSAGRGYARSSRVRQNASTSFAGINFIDLSARGGRRPTGYLSYNASTDSSQPASPGNARVYDEAKAADASSHAVGERLLGRAPLRRVGNRF